MKKHALFLFLALFSVSAFLFAGGRQNSAGAKGGTLEFWTVFTGADGVTMQEMVDAYNATNPAYRVNHRPMEQGDLYMKLPLAVQTQQDVPDIAINHVERLDLHAGNGLIEDITPYLSGSKINRANYISSLWDASNIRNGHYGIPLDMLSVLMFVNMDLYNKYGNGALDDDFVTWDEIKAAAPSLVRDGLIPVSLSWLRVDFLTQYAQLGGTGTSDGRTPLVNDANARRVLQNWVDIQQAGYIPKEGDDEFSLFLGGKTMYFINGTWDLNLIKNSGMNYKITNLVLLDPSKRGHYTSSHQFVLPRLTNRDSAKTTAALDFIDFIGGSSMLWAEAGQIPARVDIVNNPRFDTLPQAFAARMPPEMLKVITYPYHGYQIEALDKVLGEILYGRMPIDAGLRQADQETADRIKAGG